MSSPACCWCWRWRSPSTPRSNGSSARLRSGGPVPAPARPPPTNSPPAPPCSRRPDGGWRVFDLTLTFDNGPEPGVTPRVLDILGEARHQDDLLRDRRKTRPIPRAGSLRRAPMTKATGSEITHIRTRCRSAGRRIPTPRENEIGRTQAAIGGLAHPKALVPAVRRRRQSRDRLLKPSVVDYLTRDKHSCVLWNAIPRDWDDPTDGSSGRWCNADRSHGAFWCCTISPAARWTISKAFSTAPGKPVPASTRNFPPDCVPIRSGEIVRSIKPYVSSIEEEGAKIMKIASFKAAGPQATASSPTRA